MLRVDLTGQVFGKLTVEGLSDPSRPTVTWRCRCSCGGVRTAKTDRLKNGEVTSCGCDMSDARDRSDYTNHRFGIVTALERVNHVSWRVRCDCGNERVVWVSKLVTLLSCGCLHGVATKNRLTRHGEGKRTDGRLIAEYQTWASMRARCNCDSSSAFDSYGRRGIYVCERWSSYEAFLEDMGRRPSDDHSIDRIDVNGSYTCGKHDVCSDCREKNAPANCQWATKQAQAQNKRTSRLVTAFGETHCVAEWARRLNMNTRVLHGRLDSGLSLEDDECRRPKEVRCKVTEDNVREIRRRALGGESAASIGVEFGVTPHTVRSIVSKKRWKNVE